MKYCSIHNSSISYTQPGGDEQGLLTSTQRMECHIELKRAPCVLIVHNIFLIFSNAYYIILHFLYFLFLYLRHHGHNSIRAEFNVDIFDRILFRTDFEPLESIHHIDISRKEKQRNKITSTFSKSILIAMYLQNIL
jgi:hypothetical protein